MSDVALRNAEAKAAEARRILDENNKNIEMLRQQNALLSVELNNLNEFIRMWHDMAGIPAPLHVAPLEIQLDSERRKRPKNPNKTDIARTCVEYIRKAGRPLSRKELFDQLKMDGIIVRGKNEEMVLSTMLWREKEIIQRLRSGGYWPAGEVLPAAEALRERELEMGEIGP